MEDLFATLSIDKVSIGQRLGPGIQSMLGPGKLVLTGSYLLDHLDGTRHAREIDFVGTPNGVFAGCRILERLGYCAVRGEKNMCILRGEGPDIYLFTCEEGTPEEHVFRDPLSRNRVYYDGQRTVTAPDWTANPKKCMMMKYHADEMNAYLLFLVKIPSFVPRDDMARLAARMIKYQKRGYKFTDVDGTEVLDLT